MHISDWLPPNLRGAGGDLDTRRSRPRGRRGQAKGFLLVAAVVAATLAALLLLDHAGYALSDPEDLHAMLMAD